MNMLTKRLADTLKAILESSREPNAVEAPSPEDVEKLLEDYQKEIDVPRNHYHLIFAEVIYRGKNSDVRGTRVNVFTKASDMLFPSRRLHHIQNSCAMQAKIDLDNPKFFDVQAVNILGMYYLGDFTDTEFYMGIEAVEETAPAEKSADGKVVPILKKD